jgi:hypothetical protein
MDHSFMKQTKTKCVEPLGFNISPMLRLSIDIT